MTGNPEIIKPRVLLRGLIAFVYTYIPAPGREGDVPMPFAIISMIMLITSIELFF